MVVSKQLMIDKMIGELQQAKEAKEEHKFTQHLASVRLLCDILLEDYDGSSLEEGQISEQELKAMVGETKQKHPTPKDRLDDDANGDSIFDF